jgi:hypothetical protein
MSSMADILWRRYEFFIISPYRGRIFLLLFCMDKQKNKTGMAASLVFLLSIGKKFFNRSS